MQASRRAGALERAPVPMHEPRAVDTATPALAARSWIATACQPAVVRRSLRVAALVGTLLVAIHYSDRALTGALGPADWAKVLLSYCVPYGVATFAAVQSIRQQR